MAGTNEKLGLPRQDGMKKVWFCFDIDGTLRNNVVDQSMPPYANENIRTLLVILAHSFKNINICVWSGSGQLYAEQVVSSLGLRGHVDKVMGKQDWEEWSKDKLTIAVDDIQDTALGNIANLIVRLK